MATRQGKKRHEKLAVYPGTFDPIHNGHLEIIRRALGTFDRMIVAVGVNPEKEIIFTLEERLDMIRKALEGNSRIECDSFDGLLVRYAERKKAQAIVRGLRAVSDFEYEFQLALINRRLNRDVETIFLMTGYKWFYTSSTIINEAASLGGSVKGLVPEIVNQKLVEKYSSKRGIV